MKYLIAALFFSFILLFGCTAESSQPTQPANTGTQRQEIQNMQPAALPNEQPETGAIQLGPNECFYNSRTSALSCGRTFWAVHKGVEYNISTVPTKVDICGMAGFVGKNSQNANDTSDTYLAYIVRDEDNLFILNKTNSQKAVGAIVYGNSRCSQNQ